MIKNRVKSFFFRQRKTQKSSAGRRPVYSIHSDLFQELINPDQVPIRIAGGFQFTEGPVWDFEHQCLLFSDIPGDTIYELSKKLKRSVFRSPSNLSNGLTYDHQRRLLACEHQSRQITRTEADGFITVLCNRYQGKLLNSPNDITVRSDGLIYFTDPIFGIPPEKQEQDVQGVYRYNSVNNEITLVAGDIKMPNGLVFSPDESILYVDSSHQSEQKIFMFEVTKNGDLTDKQEFYNLECDKTGVPDGMKIDSDGNIYCAGPGGLWIFNDSGTHLGSIELPELPSNCAWGGDDLKTLFITAQSSVYAVKTIVGGLNPQRFLT